MQMVSSYRIRPARRGHDWAFPSICLLVIAAWAFLPWLAYNGAARAAAVLATLALVVNRILDMRRSNDRISALTIVITIFGIISIGLSYLFEERFNLNDHIQPVMVLFLIAVARNLIDREPRTLYPVFWGSVLMLLVSMMSTILGLADDIGAARMASNSSENARSAIERGIGGYGLVYGVVGLIPIQLGMILNRGRVDWNSAHRAFGIPAVWAFRLTCISIVLGVYLVITAGYSIAVLLTVIGLVITINMRRLSLISLIFTVLAVAIGVSLTLLFQASIWDFMLSMFQGTLYERKIYDLYSLYSDAAFSGTVADRTDRYGMSIDAFLANPLGGGFATGNSGGHSAILDSFAKFGVVGGALYTGILLYHPLRATRSFSGHMGMVSAYALVTALLLLINTVGINGGMVLFLLAPAAVVLASQRAGSPKGAVAPAKRRGVTGKS